MSNIEERSCLVLYCVNWSLESVTAVEFGVVLGFISTVMDLSYKEKRPANSNNGNRNSFVLNTYQLF